MRRFNLRHEIDDKWLVVDGLTMEPATLGDVQVSGMSWAEACDFVDLMNSLDAIERDSIRYAAPLMPALLRRA
ncbi:hypothetical protein [Rhizobium sullae]|uniref:Uncharacterized protein n=1 Tax=Rhizobium sullae TaxID=50338 RepID=A0A2N0DEP1_RHISU|nr:hypothetical protein [Rhizobium sullae]PKA44542.1 hypothetical protein CWR43_01335 [Rhizobium sullae]UWU17946.1 hypothetical protein N2599_21810 [Rhizobium sullae]